MFGVPSQFSQRANHKQEPRGYGAMGAPDLVKPHRHHHRAEDRMASPSRKAECNAERPQNEVRSRN